MCTEYVFPLISLQDVLCKPLKADSKKLRLYETKIDSGSRLIWQVALAFSPRRSSLDQHFCEQVIRVSCV